MRNCPAFPSACRLRSMNSASACAYLFAHFIATTQQSDFSGPCIVGFGSSPSRRGPPSVATQRPDRRSPGSRAKRVSTCQGLRPRRVAAMLANSASQHTAFRTFGMRRHPEKKRFRGSMAGLWTPLSTLHDAPRDAPCMTRGQIGSLLLALSGTFTPYALPVCAGAPNLAFLKLN